MMVYASGKGYDRRTYVSVYVCLIEGEYDEQLKWPLNANITLQLLNWSQDSNHIQHTITDYKAQLDDRTIIHATDIAPDSWGKEQFISHSAISNNDNSDIRYIDNDMLCFNITIDIF